MRSELARRRFLQSLSLGAAAPLLLPTLDRICMAADGELPPLRFLFVVEGNGLPPLQVVPKNMPFRQRQERNSFASWRIDDATLPIGMEPIDAYKDRLTIVQGLSGRMCSGGHSSDHGTLGAYHANQGRSIKGATVDGLLGQHFPSIFNNVVLGVSSRKKQIDFNLSASGPGKSIATIYDPIVAYQRLFGSVADGDGRNEFSARQNLLDHVRGKIKQVQSELGTLEKDKLDAYLHAVESMRRRSQRLLTAGDRLQEIIPHTDDKYTSSGAVDRLDAHFEMATTALIGGLTNCVTISSGVGMNNFQITFKGLGITKDKHVIGHSIGNKNENSEGQGWGESERIRAYHFGLIARTLDALSEVKEGNGTMADRTVVVYLSDAAELHHSRCFEWPMVVLGNANGRLKQGGLYVEYPDYGMTGHRTINCMFNTLLHVSGLFVDDFGQHDPMLQKAMHFGPLTEIMT
ncbi:MAG: DUF1552 domain-containing protein [Planctomycetota bacterium]